jgi:hypothetical protein
MEHYVTLFDRVFLPQGLALHASLQRHCQPYQLWILCIDHDTYQVLTRLSLSNVKLLWLENVITEELLLVKPSRSQQEWCWTLTPFTPGFVFDADATVQRVTYLDADIWFCQSPRRIFNEFEKSGKNVLITEHCYAAEFDQARTSGKFCVQFVTFDRTGGERVRQWWGKRCIEWCHARFEDNKFGDQKYLDDWPERFPNEVHVLEDRRLALGPWNISTQGDANPVFYHFQGLRMNRRKVFFSSDYYFPPTIVENFYKPYVAELRSSVASLKSVGWDISKQVKWDGVPQRLLLVAKEIKRTAEKILIRQHARI